MAPTLTLPITQVLLRILMASVVGAGIYLFCRFLDKRWPDGISWLGGPVAAISLLSCASNFDFNWAHFLLLLFFICVMGGACHRRSIDDSAIKIRDLLLTLTASTSNIVAGAMIEHFYMSNLGNEPLWYLWFIVILALNPALVPALLWAAKSMKLQAGMDKHFDS